MHADLFRYVVVVYAFMFVALITFDTEQRFLKWGYERSASHMTQTAPEKASMLKHVLPADIPHPSTTPETAKDI